MTRKLCVFAAVGVGLVAVATTNPATAQKAGGILKSYSIDSPASMSIHEEVTIYALRPVMGVFNNLVMYDQHIKQNSYSGRCSPVVRSRCAASMAGTLS